LLLPGRVSALSNKGLDNARAGHREGFFAIIQVRAAA